MSVQEHTKTTSTVVVTDDLQAQRAYVKNIEGRGFDFSLVVADAFVRGVRDIGYKSTATALDELIDNSIQAGTQNIHVIFGYGANSDAKPIRLAVLDDGHGMDPDMIRLAVIWGGTHRENDRTGFGRYGYGLPSASVSQGRAFTVYSKTEDSQWSKVTIDVDEIGRGTYQNGAGRLEVPRAENGQLPDWIARYVKEKAGGLPLKHGTVVVIEKLDRLMWRTKASLERNLLEHFGITYRNMLRGANLFVNGSQVEPLDPLFLTPGFRYYDLDEDRAQALEPLSIDVKDPETRSPVGTIKVRFAHFPPTFARKDKARADSRNMNARFRVMKEHNGIIMMRNGRQIDVVRWPDETFLNYDRYWGVEVDFPASLDEEFSITTAKQQVVASDRIWEILKQHGVWANIVRLRNVIKKESAALKEQLEQSNMQRTSELAMVEATKFKTRKPGGDPLERQRESQKHLEDEVRKRSDQSGVPPDKVREGLLAEMQGRPFRVQYDDFPGGPFYRTAQIGAQKVLYVNKAHRFFTEVYMSQDSTPGLRAGLEVLLFVMCECEIDAEDDRRRFYEVERNEWSQRLNVALDKLRDVQGGEDDLTDEDSGPALMTAPSGIEDMTIC